MAAEAEKNAARGARIKELREATHHPETGKQLTQEEMGTELKVSYRTIQAWEAGSGTKSQNIKALADFFKKAQQHGMLGLDFDTSRRYIECGASPSEGTETPEPFPKRPFDLAALQVRLDRIEGLLRVVLKAHDLSEEDVREMLVGLTEDAVRPQQTPQRPEGAGRPDAGNQGAV